MFHITAYLGIAPSRETPSRGLPLMVQNRTKIGLLVYLLVFNLFWLSNIRYALDIGKYTKN